MTSTRIMAALLFWVAATLVAAPFQAFAHKPATATELEAARQRTTAVPPLRALADAIASDPSLNPRRDMRLPTPLAQLYSNGWVDWGIWIVTYLLISVLSVALFGSIATAGAGEHLGSAIAGRSRDQSRCHPRQPRNSQEANVKPALHSSVVKAH